MHPTFIKAQDDTFVDIKNTINLYGAFLLGSTILTSILFQIAKQIDNEKAQSFYEKYATSFGIMNTIGNVGLVTLVIIGVLTSIVKVANFVAPDDEHYHCEDTRKLRCH